MENHPAVFFGNGLTFFFFLYDAALFVFPLFAIMGKLFSSFGCASNNCVVCFGCDGKLRECSIATPCQIAKPRTLY